MCSEIHRATFKSRSLTACVGMTAACHDERHTSEPGLQLLYTAHSPRVDKIFRTFFMHFFHAWRHAPDSEALGVSSYMSGSRCHPPVREGMTGGHIRLRPSSALNGRPRHAPPQPYTTAFPDATYGDHARKENTTPLSGCQYPMRFFLCAFCVFFLMGGGKNKDPLLLDGFPLDAYSLATSTLLASRAQEIVLP